MGSEFFDILTIQPKLDVVNYQLTSIINHPITGLTSSFSNLSEAIIGDKRLCFFEAG
jgi:hypothetical protein